MSEEKEIQIPRIGIESIVRVVDAGLNTVAVIDGDGLNTWPVEISLKSFASKLSFGEREQTILIDTGVDVFRIDIKHVQRRKEEGSAK